MFLRSVTIILPLGALGLGGCASLDNIAGGISNAPDWFKERRVEIRGEGYPDLNNVPTAAPIQGSQERLALSKEEADEARAILFGGDRSAPPDISARDMQDFAETLRPQLRDIKPKPEGHLSQAEIDALRAQVGNR